MTFVLPRVCCGERPDLPSSPSSLGTAIAACTAIYSVVYSLALKPLPYPHPDQIVRLQQVGVTGVPNNNFSDPNFEDLREQTTRFRAMAKYRQSEGASVLVGEVPFRALVASVSRGFFNVFATDPRIGRRFSADEAREGGPPAAIVSDGFWREHFAADRDLSKLRVKINGEEHFIVGVMPPGFAFRADTEMWTPREASGRNPFRMGHNCESSRGSATAHISSPLALRPVSSPAG